MISSGQAFWIRASGSSPTLIADETVKASPTGSFQFYRLSNPSEDKLTISLSNGTAMDQAFLKINPAAKSALDDYDGPKLDNSLFNLSTVSSDNIKMAINATNDFSCSQQIELNIVKPGTTTIPNGNYQMSFEGTGFLWKRSYHDIK